jgi:hypothetical protein
MFRIQSLAGSGFLSISSLYSVTNRRISSASEQAIRALSQKMWGQSRLDLLGFLGKSQYDVKKLCEVDAVLRMWKNGIPSYIVEKRKPLVRDLKEQQQKLRALLPNSYLRHMYFLDAQFQTLSGKEQDLSSICVNLDREQEIHRILTSWINDREERRDLHRKATGYLREKCQGIEKVIDSVTLECEAFIKTDSIAEGIEIQKLLSKRSELIDELLIASEQEKSLLALTESYRFRN